MTPESQRIALAEWAGWTIRKRPSPTAGSMQEWFWYKPGNDLFKPDFVMTVQFGFPSGNRCGNPIPDTVPNYLSDLNAVHELEKRLTERQRAVYGDTLNTVCYAFDHDYYQGWIATSDCGSFARGLYTIANATAAQRYEALLKTLSLWKE